MFAGALGAGPARGQVKPKKADAFCATMLGVGGAADPRRLWPVEDAAQVAPGLRKISLINEATSEDSLRLQSIRNISAETYGLKGFNRVAFEGLLRIFNNPDLSELFAAHMERLGLIRAHVSDPHYAKMKLLAANAEIDVTGDFADPVIQAYLKPLRKRALNNQIDPFLSPVSERQRLNALLSMFAKSLENLDPQKADSLEAIKTVLMEVQRLHIEGRLNPKRLETTLASLSGFARYKVRDLKVPLIVSYVTGFVPVVGPVVGSVISAWNHIYEQASRHQHLVKDLFIEVTKRPIWQKMEPKTLEIVFGKRDYRDLKPRAYRLIENFGQRESLFTPEFAQEFLHAYPEVGLLFANADEDVTESPFGHYHPEVQHVLYRSALLLALYKNDFRAFSKISRQEFSLLRRKMFGSLGLLDDGVITTDEIDLLLTFFVTDVLGRAQGALVDAVDEDFHVSRVVGHYDYERRAAFLLKRYTLLSYSFARQTNANQQLILSLLDGVFTLNLEHILRLDASAASFDALKELGRRNLSFLFYRNLLTFAGGAHERNSTHSENLNSTEYARWMALKKILDRATEKDAQSGPLHAEYVQWVSEFYKIPADTDENRALLRLASIAGMNHLQIDVLRRRFQELPGSDRELLIAYLTKYPVLIYGGHEFFNICRQAKGIETDRYTFWLNSLVKIYRTLDYDPQARARIRGARDGDIRLFVEPFADLIARYGVSAASTTHLHPERFKFGYIIHVRL